MLRFRNVVTIGIFLSVLFAALHGYGADEPEDLVDVFAANGKMVAIIEGRTAASISLRPEETVQWQRAKGNLGAFLTNRHFFVVSALSGGWQALPLPAGESQNRVAILSANIALMVDGEQAVAFSATSNRFMKTRLPLGDERVAVKAEQQVAVVITSSKAYGLVAGAAHFVETRLKVQEAVQNVKITARKVTIHTAHRILTFRAANAHWSEVRL